MAERAMGLKGADLPDFQVLSAHTLAAQRVVQAGEVPIERVISDADKKVEGDWVYTIESGEEDGQPGSPYAMVVGYTGQDEEVSVPETLGGMQVRELFNQVFARNARVRSVNLPDSVRAIGLKTFFQCANLEQVRLSDAIVDFDPLTFSGCRSLSTVHLPASLETLKKRALFDCPLQELELPAGLASIEEQVADTAKIGGFKVAAENESYSTDGVALFDKSGETLMAVMRSVSDYTVPEGCRVVADAAFKGNTGLTSVTFGPDVERIGDFAFFRTGIAAVAFPESVKSIGVSAFSLCSKLAEASFGGSLESIGAQAFSKTAISSVHLPASLTYLGAGAFERTKIDFEGGTGFEIDAANKVLFTDGKALYRRETDGVTLLNPLYDLVDYTVDPATTSIAPEAFSHQGKLERVSLPEGVKSIGDRAFKACDKLTCVDMPDSIESIGDEAFWQTALEKVHIGPNVAHIGAYAFEVAGATRKHERRTLRSIEVDPQNERYYFEENLLIERREGGDRALMFVEPRDSVAIPKAVTEIAETAFYHAHLAELRVHSGVTTVGPHALLGIDNLDRVIVEFPEPQDGFSEVTVEFPHQARDMEDFTRPLCIDSDGLFFDFATYDSMVVHEMDPTAVFRMILSRFEQPVKLGEAARAHFESAIKGFMNPVLRRYAQECNIAGYEKLAKHGYLQGETLDLALRIAESEAAEDAAKYLASLTS